MSSQVTPAGAAEATVAAWVDDAVAAGPEIEVRTDAAPDPAWDRFVAGVDGGDVVQTSAWAAAKRALGLETCRVVLRRDGAILGGGLLVARRFGALGAVGYVARGPVLVCRSAALGVRAMQALEDAARAMRVRHLIVQPIAGASVPVQLLAERGYGTGAPDVAPAATFAIDLRRSLDAVFGRLAQSKRTQVRRSERAGVTVRVGDRADLALFHALHDATGQRQRFEGRSMAYLEAHWDALAPSGMVTMRVACHEGRPLAATWLTTFGGTVTQRLSGSLSNDPQLQVNVACRWDSIRWAHGAGYTTYDLSGADPAIAALLARGEAPPPEFHKSFDAIKREFGGEPRLFPEAWHRLTSPALHAMLSPLYTRVSQTTLARRFAHRLRNG